MLVRLARHGKRFGSAITGGAFGPEGGLTGLGAQLLGLLILWLWAKRRAVVDLPPMESGP
jgi:hypothetical protein